MCQMLVVTGDNMFESKLLSKWTCLELSSVIRLQRATDQLSHVCMCVRERNDELTLICAIT